jgi:hypothetical protein
LLKADKLGFWKCGERTRGLGQEATSEERSLFPGAGELHQFSAKVIRMSGALHKS